MTNYYSRSKGKFIDIANMPDQYVRNAFVKMCSEESNYKKLAEDNFISSVADLDKIESLIEENNKLKKQLENTTYQPYDNQGKVRDYQVEFTKLARQRDKWKEKSMNMIEKNTYQAIFDKCQKLEEEVRLLRGSREMAYDRIKSFMPKGDVKMFSEIPNTDDGWEFVRLLKKYLNNVSYKLRVRGQYLDDETKKNEGWQRYSFGQPIEKSKCLRVYVDINNKDVD